MICDDKSAAIKLHCQNSCTFYSHLTSTLQLRVSC